MSNSTIGLDIGTNGVRAVELSLGRKGPRLVRYGQVKMPAGAVVGGEIADATAVGEALRKLWKEVGFSSKRVVVGIANARVVARVTTFPAMSDAELATALDFSVQELVPMAVEDAIIDHRVVERRRDEEGTEMLSVLVVAAHRDVVAGLMEALDRAGLSVERIGYSPLALVRSAGGKTDPGESRAIVDVGAGTTNLVVHEGGLPRFARTMAMGGEVVTQLVQERLGVERAAAEGIKRTAAGPSDPAGAVVDEALEPFVDELRDSLEFHLDQAGSRLAGISLTGAGSRLAGLPEYLAESLGVAVEFAEPLRSVDVHRARVTTRDLAGGSDGLAVAVGLALSGSGEGPAERLIDLVPPEIAVGRRARRQVLAGAAAVLALALALGGVTGVRGVSLSHARDDVRAAQGERTELEAAVGSLAHVATAEADVAARQGSAIEALEGDIDWTGLLRSTAGVTPPEVRMASFEGSRAAGSPTTGVPAATGTVTISATGNDHTSTARWLAGLESLPHFDQAWVPSSVKTPESSGPSQVSFTSNAGLTEAAQSNRLGQYLPPQDAGPQTAGVTSDDQ